MQNRRTVEDKKCQQRQRWESMDMFGKPQLYQVDCCAECIWREREVKEMYMWALFREAHHGCMEMYMHKSSMVAKLDYFSESEHFLSLYIWPSLSAKINNVILCSIIPNSGQTSLKSPLPFNFHTIAQTIMKFMNDFYDVISETVGYSACVCGLFF